MENSFEFLLWLAAVGGGMDVALTELESHSLGLGHGGRAWNDAEPKSLNSLGVLSAK